MEERVAGEKLRSWDIRSGDIPRKCLREALEEENWSPEWRRRAGFVRAAEWGAHGDGGTHSNGCDENAPGGRAAGSGE